MSFLQANSPSRGHFCQHHTPNVILLGPLDGDLPGLRHSSGCLQVGHSRKPKQKGLEQLRELVISPEVPRWAGFGQLSASIVVNDPQHFHFSTLYPPHLAGPLTPVSSRCPDGCHSSRPHMLTTLRGRRGTGAAISRDSF